MHHNLTCFGRSIPGKDLREAQFDGSERDTPLHAGGAQGSVWLRRLNLDLQARSAASPAADAIAGTGQLRMLPRKTVRRAKQAAQERCGVSGTSLSLSAIRPSSGSEPAFIFCIALLRCTFTVASAMPMSWAICLLKRPRAT